ncbi:hypothetical protein KGF56_002017 [Candida oxycetoniae]|uniref:triacylglycerol lipase n=1 Tax=Candida oxycetoniae TaxID=497107 RepID=A0AAI9SYM2_9ASCO|nr:uncharacterized protein KGF56_002017 [Candida oxycetoniae]KAI3405179.2 hypothetical protein KGF56_002017 [Candida oxycetoniae]
MELQLSQPNAFTQLYGWKDDCSQKALEAVIPQCTRGVENISPEQQKLVAMELSICEFENNGIQYPLECYEEVRKIQIGGCIRALEKSPQFWTSFSGNYRNVKEVCHQVSLPYEKSQIIEVYENVTAIYQSLVRDLKASHSHSEQVQDQLEKKFAEIFSVIDSLLMDNMMRKEEMNSTFSQFHENFEATMNNALVIITNSYQGVNTNIQEMESHLNYFTSELRDITSLLSQQRNELNSQQEALIKNNQHLLFQQNELVAMAKIHAQDIHHSTQQHALSLHKQLQYSEFTLQSIDAILNQNVNGLYLQRTQIIEQTSYIMDHFAKSLSEYLNLSAQSSIWTFENTLQTSLENLETKINQTTESLAVMNATLYACTSFVCALGCESRFPNMSLVYQWSFDDSVTGYIAKTYENVFRYDQSKSTKPKKTIIVSLRGTQSVFDSFADMKVDMTNYNNLGLHLTLCGERCKVHRGFYEYFKTTQNLIHQYIEEEMHSSKQGLEDYELIILGHSLGGSVALLLGLFYLDLGYDKLTLVTMGQPLLGNYEFVKWTDYVLGSQYRPRHNSFERKFLRVIHKDDVITVIPRGHSPLYSYHQFDNQVYLNCSERNTHPTLEEVLDCSSARDENCILKDFPDHHTENNYDYLQIHITYFRRMGLCGIGRYE